MEKRNKTRIAPSMRKILLLLLALFIPVIFISVGFLLHSLSQSEDAVQTQMENTIDSAIKQLNEELSSTNLYLSSLLVGNADIRTAALETDTITVNNALRSLHSTLASQSQYLVRKYNYLYYNPEKDVSIWKLDSVTPYSDNMKMKNKLISKIGYGTLALNAQTWSYEFLEGRLFLLQAYKSDYGYMICWMPVDTAFSFLHDTLSDDRGFYTLINERNTALQSGTNMKEYGITLQRDGTIVSEQDYHHSVHTVSRLNLRLLVVSSLIIDYGSLGTFITFILFIVLLLLCFSLYTLYYFSHYISRPFEHFRRHVSSYAEHFKPEKRRGFAELNEAVSAFDSLTQQLRDLKISMYEERLTLAKTELEYFQLQIKPHFFINCFGIIFNMSQNEEFETIQQFCMSLSNYVRYLFKDGFSVLSLQKELELTREYLQIQNIRHHTQLFLSESIEDPLMGLELPPLLILTFVENSVKHAVNKQDLGVVIEAEILRSTEETLVLRVTDNGPGMTAEQLQKLNETALPDSQWTESLREDTSIGVRNIAKRLYLLYGTQYQLRFSDISADHSHSGTQVSIHIPLNRKPPNPAAN